MDGFENLEPALKSSVSKVISTTEFQKMLQNWFEECGLESDLRSYLRLQMINVIKNTEIGRSIAIKPNFQSASLDKQAINMIVAEHLIQNHCHYSFSIFNTEVSLNSIFPDHRSLFNSSSVNPEEIWQFDKQYLFNILELIGISRSSTYFNELIKMYYDEGNECNSILSCIIYYLCKCIGCKSDSVKKKKKSVSELVINDFDAGKEDKFLIQCVETLAKFNLPENEISNIIKEIKNNFLKRKQNIKDDYNKIISDFKTKNKIIESKLKENCDKVNDFEEKVEKLNQENTELKLYVKNLLAKELKLRKRYSEKTTELVEKNTELQSQLKEIINSDTFIKYSEKNQCSLKHCSDICESNKLLLDKLHSENEKLALENKSNKIKFDELKNEYKSVVRDFEICRSNLKMISCKIMEQSSPKKDASNNNPLIILDSDRSNSSEFSIENLAEEILKETQLKLCQLEMENQEIEGR